VSFDARHFWQNRKISKEAMPRKQPYAILAVLSALTIVPACTSHGGSLTGSGSGNGGSSSGNGGSSSGNGGSSSGNGGSSSGGTVGSITQPPVSGLTVFGGSSCGGAITVGGSPVRRISRIEYNNMIRDLGLDPGNTQPATQFVTEQKIDNGKAGNFNTNAYATISGTLINQQYLETAEALAAAAVASSSELAAILPCTTKNAACAQTFISSWANRAFRGQLDADETTALTTLYANVSAKFDFPTGIQAVIEAVLTSPRFLFVIEFGEPDSTGKAAAVPLAPMELATRLALYLWRSIPDQALMDAANGVNGASLVSASDVATQATRMLADAKAKGALADFADQWLDIENMNSVTKDTQFTTWSASVAADMHTESLTTFTQAVLGSSSFTSLLTSGSSYINANLASFYGLSGAPTFSAATNVNSAANPRLGILSDGSVLAMHAHTSLPSPTKRGRMIRQQVLCEEVPDPPASVGGVPIPPPPATIASGTTRAAYLMHVQANTQCNSCHQYMDLIGFGFDNYNAAGLYITQENGTPVDPSGQFMPEPSSTDISGTFTGMSDMITQLSKSQQVNECFALEEIRYALLRSETDADACSAQTIYQAFSASNFNISKLLVAVVSSNSFMYRTPVTAGQACQ
jgi:hypothetical protein